jgi:hypothetical protein
VLHPWARGREDEKVETWDFLSRVGTMYEVVHREVNGDTAYLDFIKEHWGDTDLIILEDYKVPTRQISRKSFHA